MSLTNCKLRSHLRRWLAIVAAAGALATFLGCDPPTPPVQQVIYVTNAVTEASESEGDPAEISPSLTPDERSELAAAQTILEERQVYEDPDYGVSVAYPKGDWRRGGLGVSVASGEICRVWSAIFAPTNQIMLVVRKEKEPVSVDTLAWELPQEFSSSFQAAVEEKKVLKIGGQRALSLRVSGNGTGIALSKDGPVATTQRWVVIPRGVELISIIGSGPAREFGLVNRAMEEMLTTLEIKAQRPPPRRDGQSAHYVDLEYGFRLPYPSHGWVRGGAPPGGVNVPGEPCRAWSSTANPDRLITIFLQRTGITQTPLELLENSVEMAEERFGASVMEKVITNVGGMNAASMTIAGAGTGATIDGRGPIRTAQHWIFIPRRDDVVALMANAPADGFSEVESVFLRMLAELEVHGFQTPEQRQSRLRQSSAEETVQ